MNETQVEIGAIKKQYERVSIAKLFCKPNFILKTVLYYN